MAGSESRLFCRLDGLTAKVREEQRITALSELGILDSEIVPVFEEATQTTARFLEAPICILGLMTQDRQWLKSAVGLSRIGLMNELASFRQLPRSESFCTYVVDSRQLLSIPNATANPVFAQTSLVQYYGIRSYLGAPLITISGHCIGTLAAIDLEPRKFTSKEAEFLMLMARWSMCEFERDRMLKQERSPTLYWLPKPVKSEPEVEVNPKTNPEELSNSVALAPHPPTTFVRVKLLTQLSQELRTPLTSIMGMASVLGREIYGPLTVKQREYLEIIHHSGQNLVSLIDEILSLGDLDESNQKLNITSVDIEMLCQQAINSVSPIAKQRQQQIRLSIEPGNRICLLDKDKGRQMLYYLLFNVIQLAEAGSLVRIHVARSIAKLNLTVWVSHPWLGDGLQQINIEGLDFGSLQPALLSSRITETEEMPPEIYPSVVASQLPSVTTPLSAAEGLSQLSESNHSSREGLGLLLSCHLAEVQGGEIAIQGSSEAGYRYVISLPQDD